MLVKRIKFKDYNGEEREADYMFHLNAAELTELQLSKAGGMQATLEQISNEQDTKKLVELFKEIILKSYGKKSEDGLRFIKSEELSTEFSQTEAYVELFMELMSGGDAAANFISGILPKDLERYSLN